MYTKVPASSILLQTNAFEIRKLKESDYMTFLDYTGGVGEEKDYDAFRGTIDYDDMVGLFVDGRLNALFLMYEEKHEQFEHEELEGLTIGFSATDGCYNEGILTIGYGMLVNHLLDNEVDFVAGKVEKNNTNIFKVMSANGLTIFDQDNKNYYMVKMY